ncbi:MAG: hypothetical protein Q8K01_15235 [Sulfurimicrobium sp.]|nr:hypothetical protein [Sulfurimicrobium sp.]
MTNSEFLFEKYGPLVPLADVVEIFHADLAALRGALKRKSGLGAILEPAKVKMGRRIYFKSLILADILDSRGGE